MTFLTGLLGKATGGLASEIINTFKDYWPPDMSPEKKAQMQLAAERLQFEREMAVGEQIAESERAITERMAAYEGTASDLKGIPVLGPIMLFARGVQRPLWGFAAMYMDYQVFAGLWNLGTPTKEATFYIINFLVLGFLFGERAIKNISPFVVEMLKAKGK